MSDIIKIEHLNKCFGDVKAVNDLSFRVKKGELFAFLGVNGAGKSTLLRVLLGELTPPGCKMNRLGELAYIPQLDEVTL